MITPETILQHYGYIALLAGTIFEGETILILAGFAAHRGYLNLPLVWFIAFCGGFIGDQFYFYLGRYKGKNILATKEKWRPRIIKVNSYIEKYQFWIILGFRFFYGTRTMIPFALGMSNIKTGRFVILNAVSGVIWAVLIGSGGYFFGAALESLFGDIRHYEEYIMGGVLLAGLIIWLIHRRRRT